MKVYDPEALAGAPDGFRSKDWRAKDLPGMLMTIQVSPDDCTGCGICIEVCPAKDKTNPEHKSLDSLPKLDHLEQERESWEFFLGLPEIDRTKVQPATVKGSQMLQPLFEFSGACAGCGETPYLKLLTPAVRRPAARRERDRLLVDLRRQPADDAVDDERRRPRAGVVELAVRGQRRVRLRHAARARPAGRPGATAARRAERRAFPRSCGRRSSTRTRATRPA